MQKDIENVVALHQNSSGIHHTGKMALIFLLTFALRHV